MITNLDLDYLHCCLTKAQFTPYLWNGEDKNLAAFNSMEELIHWYCQPPGIDGQPYRDRGFYCRELAYLSRVIRPRTIAEFGTSLGIGTCLLRWLNPNAYLATVDINDFTFLPGDVRVQMGLLAHHQEFPCDFFTGDAQHWRNPGIDLCFIDAGHTYNAVMNDSYRAYANRAEGDNWAIVWHDYNNRHPGVIRAVTKFCNHKKLRLRSREDSDTVWVMGGRQ